MWPAASRGSIEYLSLSGSLLICSSTCGSSSPCLIAGLWEAAARGVGLHWQSYICLSVITNQEDGYMGNYHWQLIPEAYRGIPDTSPWSLCLCEGPHGLVIDITETCLISAVRCLCIHMFIQSHTHHTVLYYCISEELRGTIFVLEHFTLYFDFIWCWHAHAYPDLGGSLCTRPVSRGRICILDDSAPCDLDPMRTISAGAGRSPGCSQVGGRSMEAGLVYCLRDILMQGKRVGTQHTHFQQLTSS